MSPLGHGITSNHRYYRFSENKINQNVLNVFINIQTSKELIQMDTDKMMTYGTFTVDDEKLTQS